MKPRQIRQSTLFSVVAASIPLGTITPFEHQIASIQVWLGVGTTAARWRFKGAALFASFACFEYSKQFHGLCSPAMSQITLHPAS